MTRMSLCMDSYRKLPIGDICQYTGLSAVLSFGASFVLLTDIKRAVFTSTFAATASLINGLVAPLFELFLKRKFLHWYETPIRPIVNFGATHILSKCFYKNPSFRVDIIPFLCVLSTIDAATAYFRPSKTLSVNQNVVYLLI